MTPVSTPVALYPPLQTYCETLPQEFSRIAPERKKILDEMAAYIYSTLQAHRPVHLTFICTHNSRRSQFGQVWGKVAATWYGWEDQVITFSGGTEVTACHSNSVAALQRAGFQITSLPAQTNPNQQVQYAPNSPALTLFSKKYSDSPNPQKDFCALMVCSHADEACPVVYGAEKRISLPYIDPKRADGTAEEKQAYDATCREIARELFYVFAEVRKRNE